MDKLKSKLQNADWWEIGYLVIYAAVFCYEFLNTTMFQVQWPPKFGYIFFSTSALYLIAKFIWHNTYTKKDMIFSAIILVAFIIPAVFTDYSFLFWTGFLIVGAKDIDFNKILKVYITIGILVILAAFVASQAGWIEHLIYIVPRGASWAVRYSFGSVYPTDFTAHLVFLLIAGMCLYENKISWGKIVNFIFLGWFVLDKCDAKTGFICSIAMALLLVYIYLFKDKQKGNTFFYVLNSANIVLAVVYIAMTHLYDAGNATWTRLNDLISNRLGMSSQAIERYNYKFFGQTIEELGFGRTTEQLGTYFYIDDSYIRIALEYGVIVLVVVLIMLWCAGVKAIKSKRYIIVAGIAIIALHSFMEHHLLQIAYNPMLCLVFAKCSDLEENNLKQK